MSPEFYSFFIFIFFINTNDNLNSSNLHCFGGRGIQIWMQGPTGLTHMYAKEFYSNYEEIIHMFQFEEINIAFRSLQKNLSYRSWKL